MAPKDKPKRGGAKPFDRETKPKASAKPGFSAKEGVKPRKAAAGPAAAGKTAPPKTSRPAAVSGEAPANPERISKILARAGVASRRDVERMIMEGRVRLNGQVLETPVVNATLEDRIEVDGQPIRGIERTRLWLYHKPAGLVTTNADPEGRPTVFDNLPEGLPRVLSIGRLDINTEGLLLLTNDGGLSRVLELPTTGWLRRYRVRAHGEIEQADLDKLKEGIAVEGVLYGSIEATLDRIQGRNVWITMGLREGKNREIKNVLGALGLEVNRLIRISYGPFQLGDLPEGQVIEVRGRTLRDQLGPRLIEEAKANFDAPVYNDVAADEEKPDAPSSWAGKPERREKSDRSRDGKPETRRDKGFGRPDTRADKRGPDRGYAGRGSRDDHGDREEKPKKRAPMGTSRTANVWMAPGARPTPESKAKKSSARAQAEHLFDRPKPVNDRRVVVNRVEGDDDWIRADAPAQPDKDDFGRRGTFGDRPAKDERPFRERPAGGERPYTKPRGERSFADRPRGDRKPRQDEDRPARSYSAGEGRSERPRGERPSGGRPFRERPAGGERPYDKPRGERSFADRPRGDRKPREEGDRPARSYSAGEGRSERPRGERPSGDRPFGDKPRGARPGGKSFGGRPGGGKSFGGAPAGGRGKPGGAGGKPGGKPGGRPGGRPAGGKPRNPKG